MSKYIFMAYDSGGIKMNDKMLEATKNSLVFDFSRNSIYTQGNEFGYTDVIATEIPTSQLDKENRKLITNVYKTLTGEIGVTYTSIGTGDGDGLVGGVELSDVAVISPTTYANVISNITQDGLGQIGYTYTRIYTGHSTEEGIENNSGSYSINGVYLSEDGKLTYSFIDLSVNTGTKVSTTVLGKDNTNNINVVIGISASADGKITYSYSDISTYHYSTGEEDLNYDSGKRVITNAYLDENGHLSYTYENVTINNDYPKYEEAEQLTIEDNNVVVKNISTTTPNTQGTRVVTDVKLLQGQSLTIGLKYSYSYIYSDNAHHSTEEGNELETIYITSNGTPLISGAYLSVDGTLSYSYSNYIVRNSTYAEVLSYIEPVIVNHDENLSNIVNVYKDSVTGRLIVEKVNFETIAGNLDEIRHNDISYFDVIDNIYQYKDGKITYTSKRIVNTHTYEGTNSRTNHIINNINIDSYGNLTYTYYDASTNSGVFTNTNQIYNSHHTGISGVDDPTTYIPITNENSISLINGIKQDADGKISYSYISLYGDTNLFTKHIFNLNNYRDYTANEFTDNTVKVVYLMDNNGRNNQIDNESYLNYSTAEVPTKHYIDSLISTNDALRYCGTITASTDENGTVTLNYNAVNTGGFDSSNPDTERGAVYKVSNTGYFGTEKVCAGDMIISNSDNNSKTPTVTVFTGWDVINENIDLRQVSSRNQNSLEDNLVITSVHLSADGELSYTYYPSTIITEQDINWGTGEDLRIVPSQVKTFDINTNSTANIGVPVITSIEAENNGLEHIVKFKVTYIYSSQRHHSSTGVQNSNNAQVISNINLSVDGELTYTFNTESAVTYTGNLEKVNVPETKALDIVDILHQDESLENNIGYNVITGVKLERKENEVSLSYTYTPIYASKNHHSTVVDQVVQDVVLSAEGSELINQVNLSSDGTLYVSKSNIILADAGTVSSIAAKELSSYTHSVVNIYKDPENNGIVTYSYVNLSTEEGTLSGEVTIREETPLDIITGLTQRGDGKITYSYQRVNIASLWERGEGENSVKVVNSGSNNYSSYSISAGYMLLGTGSTGESVFGQYNSNNESAGLKTIHTIGIGYYDFTNSTEVRKNAIEILTNGDFYLYGVGNYDGTNSNSGDSISLQQYFENKEYVISSALNDLHNKDIDLQNQINNIPLVWENGDGERSAQTIGTESLANGDYSVAEGYDNTANGDYSHSEGLSTESSGQSSHTEGEGTVANNIAEHAQGRYNVSNYVLGSEFGSGTNTIHSIGIGTSNSDRKNAIEVMQNGDVFLYGIGDYDGTNYSDATTLQAYLINAGVWERGSGLLSVQTKETGSIAYGDYSVAEGYYSSTGGDDTEPKTAPDNYGVDIKGSFAHAEGRYTVANGYMGAHAEGNRTLSSGISSHAEGSINIASGNASHAEGNRTVAAYNASHSEGTFTYSSGQSSHAEGFYSYALREASHAEGHYTYSYGIQSHTEGSYTYTFGTSSHSEGAYTYAYGNNSHAEGGGLARIPGNTDIYYTFAIGLSSHAEGIGTYAYGEASHAEGTCAYALGNNSHAEGGGIGAVFGSGQNIFFTTAVGNGSHAEGIGTYAYGGGSHTEGYFSYSVGEYTHAEGRNTYANGSISHAEGNMSYANGNNSHAEGFKTISSGNNSHAEGNTTTSSGEDSHSEGINTIASGSRAHAEGNASKATGNNTHSEGQNTIASGTNSHSEGNGTSALGAGSHAEGLRTISGATGIDYTHTEGQNTNALGTSSHAEGQNTYALKANSHAEGVGTYAYLRAHSEGHQTHAEGENSHTEGRRTWAIGNNSHAEGLNTYSYNISEHASGQFNLSHTLPNSINNWLGSELCTVSSVGIGSQVYDSETNTQITIQKNAIEIMQNGDFYLYGIGDYDGTNPDSAVTLQTYLTTAGVWQRGEGELAVQTKETNSYAIGDYSVASGRFTYAYNTSETAIGQYNISNIYEGEAFGYTYNTIYSIGIGTSEETRKNAVEVTQSGEIYLLGIGDYDGTNTELAYSLKEVIIEDELIISYAFNDLDQRIDILDSKLDSMPEPVFQKGTGLMSIVATDSGSTSLGTYSFTVGEDSHSTGEYSFTLGSLSSTSGVNSMTIGNYSTTFDRESFTIGNSNKNYGISSINIGNNNYSTGNKSSIVGHTNSSYSGNTVIFGNNSYIDSNSTNSVAIGYYNNLNSSANTFIIGYNSISDNGNYSTLLGIGNTNNAQYASVIGYNNTNNSNYGINIGYLNTNSGSNSISIGTGINTNNDDEISIGKYNFNSGNVFELGIGTSNNDRKNAFEINSEGELYLFGIGEYIGNNASTAKSLQLYLEENERTISEALNDLNDRILDLNDEISSLTSSPFEYGNATKSIKSIGTNCFALGEYSFAEGSNTVANNNYEVALGFFNISNLTNNIYGNSLNTALSLGIGTSEETRKNAFEVMQNGDLYIYGIGDYNGTNAKVSNSSDKQAITLQNYLETNERIISAALNDLNLRLLALETSDDFDFELSNSLDNDGNDVISITINGITKSITLTNSWTSLSE